MGKLIDLTGQRFGHLVVLERDEYNKHGEATWRCHCDCGNVISVQSYNLRTKHTQSCGCLAREASVIRMTTHAECKTRLYTIWKHMKERCYNPNNKRFLDYGGRNITVCKEWKNDFTAFRNWALQAGYDETAPYGICTLDRIDNSKGYSPDNCRWVNAKQQSLNRRSNCVLTYQGESKTISEWAEQLGVRYAMLRRRLNRGWSIEKTLTTPSQRPNKKE